MTIRQNGNIIAGYPDKFVFSLVPVPASATVTITGGTQVKNAVIAKAGTSVHWAVSKDGYETQEGDKIIGATDETLLVELVEKPKGIIYGYKINQAEPNPETRVSYLPDSANASFTPCKMNFGTDTFEWGSWQDAFFIPKPCALRYDGTVAYYLDPTDFTKKADGSPSDVSDSSFGGNFMMEFPKIFVSTVESGEDLIVKVSNEKIDDSFECWSCKRADGTYNDHFYLPMFQGIQIDDKLRSVGLEMRMTVSNTAEKEATMAEANGDGWNTTLLSDEISMWAIFPLMFKSTNSQIALGNGTRSHQNALLNRGIMYGKEDGGTAGVIFMGLHNWWAAGWRRINGLLVKSGKYFVKLTNSTVDGSSVVGFNRTGDGYIDTGVSVGPDGFISKMSACKKSVILPVKSGASDTTFYCDRCFGGRSECFPYVGGNNGSGFAGIYCIYLGESASNATSVLGASISYHKP